MFNKIKNTGKSDIIAWVLSVGIVIITLMLGLVITLGIYYVYTVVAGVEFTLHGFLVYFLFFT